MSSGNMQSEYICRRAAWEHAIEALGNSSLVVEPSVDNTDNSILLNIKSAVNSPQELILCAEFDVESATEGKVTILWLKRAIGEDPSWMFKVARQVEDALVNHGASCVFGAVR